MGYIYGRYPNQPANPSMERETLQLFSKYARCIIVKFCTMLDPQGIQGF